MGVGNREGEDMFGISHASGTPRKSQSRVWIVLAVGAPLILAAVALASGDKQAPPASPAESFDPERCFDRVWQIVQKQFWDPRFNGVDWEEAGKRYRPEALRAAGHEEFAAVVNRMLAELRTSHTCYLTRWDPDYYTLQAALLSQTMADCCTSEPAVVERQQPGHYSSQGRPHRTGIGIVTRQIDGRHYVSHVLAQSPAQKAGVLLGDLLLEVDAQPFHPIRSFEDKAGREVELILQRGPAESSRLRVKVTPEDREEKDIWENDSGVGTRIVEHQGHRFAYMPLGWLSGWLMREVLDRGFDLACNSEGILIDLRHGFGGSPVIEYIDPFLRTELQGTTDEMILRDRRIAFQAAFGGPVIVLINGNTRSGKELLAYYFQKSRRATLLGERTAGSVSGGRMHRICEHSLLYCCVAMITIDGKRLEAVGVEPDIEVPFDIRFAAGRDLQFERAKDEMVKLLHASPQHDSGPE
jgi:carboxyl-terminal processing protease